MGCGCLSKNVGSKVNEPVRSKKRNDSDNYVLKVEKVEIAPTPPRSEVQRHSARQQQSKSRNQNIQHVGSSFGNSKPERPPSSHPFVRDTPQRLLNHSEESKQERSRPSRSASPKPKKQKQVLMELNIPASRSKGEHIYFVSRSIQLHQPISGPQQWEIVLMKAVQVSNHELVLKILNLTNRNWMIEQALAKEHKATKAISASNAQTLQDLKVIREEIALHQHFNWLLWAVSRYYFDFEKFKNMRGQYKLPSPESREWSQGFVWKGVYFRLVPRINARFIKNELVALKYAALEIDNLQQTFNKKLTKRNKMTGGVKATSGKSKMLITQSFLPLLSIAESGAFLIYATPCIMLGDNLDPQFAKMLTRNSGLMYCNGEHFYDTSPAIKLEGEDKHLSEKPVQNTPLKNKSPAALQDMRRYNEDTVKELLVASLFNEMPILQNIGVNNILPVEIQIQRANRSSRTQIAKKFLLLDMWSILPDIHNSPDRQLMMISAEGEREIELYPFPKLESMELTLVYSLLSGQWDKNSIIIDHGSKTGNSELQRSTVVGGSAGFLKGALNPTGILHHNGQAHMSSVSKNDDRYSLRNTTVPNAVSLNTFRSFLFNKSGWAFKLIHLREDDRVGKPGMEPGGAELKINQRAGLLFSHRDQDLDRSLLIQELAKSTYEPEQVKQESFKVHQTPRSIFPGAMWSVQRDRRFVNSASIQQYNLQVKQNENIRGNVLISGRYKEGAKLKYPFISPRDAHNIKRQLFRAFVRSLIFVRNELDSKDLVLNSLSLKELMHRRGLNIRYLWVLLVLLQNQKSRQFVASQILARAVKKVVLREISEQTTIEKNLDSDFTAAHRCSYFIGNNQEQINQIIAAIMKSVFQFRTQRKPIIHEIMLELWLSRLKIIKTAQNELNLSLEQQRKLKSRQFLESVIMSAVTRPVYFITSMEWHLNVSFTEEFLRSARADKYKLLRREISTSDIQNHDLKVKSYMSLREYTYCMLARQLKKSQIQEKRANAHQEEEDNAALTAHSFSGGGLGRGDGIGAGANTLETASMMSKEKFRISFMQQNQQRSHRKESKFQRKLREVQDFKGDSSSQEGDGGVQCKNSSRKAKLMQKYQELGKKKLEDGKFAPFVSPRSGFAKHKGKDYESIGGGAVNKFVLHSPPIDRSKLEKLCGQGDTAKLTELQHKFGAAAIDREPNDMYQAVVQLLKDVNYFNEIILPSCLYKIGIILTHSNQRSFFSNKSATVPYQEYSLPFAAYYELPSLEEIKRWIFLFEKALEKIYCVDGSDTVLAEAYCYQFLHLYFQNTQYQTKLDEEQFTYLEKIQEKLTKYCVYAPPQLYVTMHSFVAMFQERKDTALSEINYLCALTQLQKMYGDARGRGNIGVPWALLPSWKLILLSAYDSRSFDTEYAQEIFDGVLEGVKETHSPFPRLLRDQLPTDRKIFIDENGMAGVERGPAPSKADLKIIQERGNQYSGSEPAVLNQSDIEVEVFDASNCTPSKALDGDNGLLPEGKEPRMHMPFIHWSLLKRDFKNISDIIESLLPVPITFVNWLVRNNLMMYQCGKLWTPEQQRERVQHCGEITAPSSAAHSSVSNLNVSSASLAQQQQYHSGGAGSVADSVTARARRESVDFDKAQPKQNFKVSGYSQILGRDIALSTQQSEPQSTKSKYATYSDKMVGLKTQSSFASSFTRHERKGQTKTVTGPALLGKGGPSGSSIVADIQGSVYTWGNDVDGQLGLNSQDHTTRASQALRIMYPRMLVSMKDHIVSQVVCGRHHTIALTASRHLYSWGNNESFQLGLGTSYPKVVKRPVRIQGIQNVEQISCGTEHSVAVVEDGSLWTWGQGEGGLLGHGDCKSHSKPTKVSKIAERVYRVKKVVCGGLHTLVLSTEGKVYAWGRAEGGQIGLEYEELEKYCNENFCILSPIQVKGALRGQIINDISCGEVSLISRQVHSLALARNGKVYAWGWGENGQLGLGFSSDSFEPGTGGSKSIVFAPREIRALEGQHITNIYTGATFSFFLNSKGELLAAGMNDMSQLGIDVQEQEIEMKEYIHEMRHRTRKGVSVNYTTDIVTPQQVDCFINMQVREIGCGENHCLAVTGDSKENLWSWGQHKHGQLGHGELKKFQNPRPVQPFFGIRSDLKSISCGAYHSVIVVGDSVDLYDQVSKMSDVQVQRFGNVRRVDPLNFWGVDSAPEWNNGDSSIEIQR